MRINGASLALLGCGLAEGFMGPPRGVKPCRHRLSMTQERSDLWAPARAGLFSLGVLLTQLGVGGPPAALALPQRPPESNAQALLLQALPSKSQAVEELGQALAKITTEGSGNIRSVDAKGSKGIKPWPDVVKSQRTAAAVVSTRSKELLKGVGAGAEAEASAALATITDEIKKLGDAAEQQDRDAAVKAQVSALRALDRLATMEVGSFPYQIDDEYAGMPRLLGRAEVEMTVKAAKTGKTSKVVAVVDGFSAPLTAGHFVELASKGSFDRSVVDFEDESSVVFKATDKSVARKVPLEIFAVGDKAPSYGETLEEQGRFTAKTVLPFNAYGTLALSHPADDVNGVSQGFFALKFDPLYTPAGLNTLDGQYAVFGYAVEGQGVFDDLQKGDVIESVKVVSGMQYLKTT